MQSLPVRTSELWYSQDQRLWEQALARYWDFVLPRNLALERQFEELDAQQVRRLDPRAWYDFLEQRYFRWKYTDPRRYASTTKHLRRYRDEDDLDALAAIKERLFSFDLNDVDGGLRIACSVRGLGAAGGSGLLAVLFPQAFGTADKFVVEALREVPGLPDERLVATMNPDQLSLRDAATLIGIMRRKAQENTDVLAQPWTPRMVDKVLWVCAR